MKKRLIIIFSLTLFVISLFLPAFNYADFDGAKTYSSFSAFLGGALAILGGAPLEWLVWLANPLYFTALILFMCNKKIAYYFGIASLSLAFSFLFFHEILASEDGREAPVTSLCSGYYLWLGSILILMTGAWRYFKILKTNTPQKNTAHFKDNFSQQSDIYLKYRPHYPKELYEYLSSLTPSPELAWDCGTGNGQAAVGLSPYFKTIVATDPSEQQIKNCIPANNVIYKIEKAEDTVLENHSVDLLTIGNALHWFDFDVFYKQAKRVLKKEGIIAAWAYALPVISTEVDLIVKQFHDDTLGKYWLPENRLVENKYKDVPFPFEEISSPSFSSKKSMTLDELIGYFNTWSGLQRFINENSYNPSARLKVDLLKVWGDPLISREIT